MRSNYNNSGNLEQFVKGALIQAEQAMQSGRLNPIQSQQKNAQIFRVTPNNAATAAGRSPQQTGAGMVGSPARLDSQPDSEVYRERPADQVPGKAAAAPGSGNTARTARADAAIAAGTADAGTNAGINAGTNAGTAETASVPVQRKAPDDLEKLLKLNFNEQNLLSGVVMAEVLGRPKCLRRGRW